MSVNFGDLEKQPLVSPDNPDNGFSASLGLEHRNTKILALCSLITISGGFLMSVFLVQSVRATTPFFIFGSSTPPFLLAFGAIYFIQRKWGGMTSEAYDVRQRDMAILGFFIFLNGLLVLYPNPYVPGMLQALLGPTVMTTPLTMVFSFIFLKRRYDIGRILCAVMILAGSAIAGTANVSSVNHSAIPVWVWTILFVASSIPAAISAVFEEHIFHGKNVAPTCLMFWISIWQTCCVLTIGSGFDMVPEFGMDAPKDFLAHQRDSFKCLLGDTSVAQWSGTGADRQCNMFCYCDNGRAAIAWILFVIGFVSQNLGSLGVVKYGSAAFSMIIATVITPLTLFGFCMPFIMGPFGASKLNWQVIVSLIAIVFGMIGYTFFDNRYRGKR